MSIATDKIKKYLKDNERTLSWLARKLGISRQAVEYWMKGEGRIPSAGIRGKLKEMFDIGDDWV